MPYAARISEATWYQHREFIRLRYLTDKRTLRDVRDELAEKGFSVTSSQLETRCKKWGFAKYLNKTTWQDISSLRANQDGEGSQIFVRGQQLGPRKIAKELKRRKLYHEGISTPLLLVQPTAKSAQSAPSTSSAATRAVACPDTSEYRDYKTIMIGDSNEHRVAAFGLLKSTERVHLLSKIINKIIDYNDSRTNWYKSDSFILEITGVVKLAKTTSLGLQPLEKSTRMFMSAISRLWKYVFNNIYQSETFERRGDNDDERFHLVVHWIMSILTNRTIRTIHYPSVTKCFQRAIKSGNVRVALLLWPLLEAIQSSHDTLTWKEIRPLAVLQTKANDLFIQKLLDSGSIGWIQLLLQSSAQYATTDNFRKLCASVISSPRLGQQIDVPDFWSASLIRRLIEGCVGAEPEDAAIEKFEFLISRIETLEPSHVTPATLMTAARHGSVRLLLALSRINQNLAERDKYGFSAIHVAADFGHLEACKWILQQSPEPQHDADSIFVTFFVTLGQGHYRAGQFLEEQFLAFHHQRQFSSAEWRALLCTCKLSKNGKSHDRLTFRVGHIDLKIRQPPGCILCAAAYRASFVGDVDSLQYYLDHGARIPLRSALFPENALNKSKYTTQITSERCIGSYRGSFRSGRSGSVCDRIKCAELLICHNGEPSQSDIMASLLAGDWYMTQILLNHRSSCDRVGDLLEAAICGQDLDCISGIRQMAGSIYHAGALCASVAFSGNSASMMDIALDLISQRAASDLGSKTESTAIFLAALQNDAELFRRLLTVIPSPNPSCSMGNLRNPFLSVAKPLRDVQAKIYNCITRLQKMFWQYGGRCPLLGLVAIYGRADSARALLEYGLQPSLHACDMAVEAQSRRALSILLHGQPPLRAWTPQGRISPLRSAVESFRHKGGNPDFSLVSQLLSAGADINLINDGKTPLWDAAGSGECLDLARFLIDQGAEVNARCVFFGNQWPTPLYHAIGRSGSAGMVELLLDRGADVNAPPAESYRSLTCLQMAVDRYDILEMLLSKSVRIDGDYRLDYILAVYIAQRGICSQAEARLKEYGSWGAEDNEILAIVKSHTRDGFLVKRPRIRKEVDSELSRRAGREAASTESPITSDDATGFETREAPESSTHEARGFSSREQSSSLQQGGEEPDWGLNTHSPLGFYDWSSGPFYDMPTPPGHGDEFDGWLNERGPRFIQPDFDSEYAWVKNGEDVTEIP
ncbi:hypothetical protein B0T11DRAFT_289972 [Plectosphaerella cucumerina]|uniref:Clr5 domain-containing protein n=1 Tax=Plectosphaerella cucumerina TaxID=40658 RepID=A0A8K0T6K9_9PEZI|nr:hypothetical protein B0T11DRAFT_289972 [Plectosphaerella cucumerina]